MEPQRLFRRQMPLIPETVTAVAGAKFPEGCIPRCTVASARLRARGNQPPFHHFLQEAVSNQSLTVDTTEIGGAKHAASAVLKFLKHSEGFSEFLVRGCHERQGSFEPLQAFYAA